MSTLPQRGAITWCDLTTEMADQLRVFYERVVGWTSTAVDMGGYSDFSMLDESAAPAAGICHARGQNKGLPPVWLVYVTVTDLDHSLAQCETGGGTILRQATDMGAMGRYAVIADPSGAAIALFEPAPEAS